ncbi:gamma-glutamyl-gamma-aminobutyrate hydrolase family protein [Candidatus Woesearchaeota archaeon]|nr:gamma-glutamyl-gamma-aminobutyrate hydrolase family protein [Candidatus Woesearchaeota archaeon]MBL7051043.1 gamma-glutamyl-gamma-aminobutyrate hydrolase family protein [Candidatus Woesearchaeota archaeon]
MILIISTCQDKLSEEEFVKPITNIVKNSKKDYKIKHFMDVGYVDDYEKIIICGTALKDNEYLNHLNKFSWLKNTNKEVLGICSGMQIIALTFNAKLIQQKEIGMTQITTKSRNKLFSKEFEVYNLHQNSLTDLDEFDILATTENDSVQAIKHKHKQFYGIIFHPEVRNETIVENFILP